MFADIVCERADHPALIVADDTLTYAELDRRSARMARALLQCGAGKGTRLALLAPDGALLLTSFYAAFRIGALVTPISTLASPPELAHILRTSDAQILVGARRFLRRDFGELLEAALPGLAAASSDRLWLSHAPYLRSVWLDNPEGLRWAHPLDALLSRGDDGPDDELLTAVEREVSPADDAFVVYTSGSTATPKAVVHGQRSLVTKPRELAKIFLMTGDDRTMPLLPAFWLGGIAAALQVLCTGSTLVYPPTPDLEDVLDTLEAHDVTYVVVWQALAKLRAAAKARGIDVDRVRGLGSRARDEHGEPIPPGLRANLFGMSESFSAHSGELINWRMPDDKVGASGRSVNGIERRVVDPETAEEVRAGEVGELQLRGNGLMTGLYKVPRELVFEPDGFYPTKDLVRIDVDGYLWFVGRTADMIKTNSANVSRLEVEAALNALPVVAQALVCGLPDLELGEMVVAAVVPAPGTNPTEDQLRTALRDRLSGFKIPRRVVFIADVDIPRTSTGKVLLTAAADLITSKLDPRTRVARQADPAAAGGPHMADTNHHPSTEGV
jgi:acyl-CoA synthetase (AMP-forming)/AMP-acid ligase II